MSDVAATSARVITFDVDQTLVDFRAAMREALDATLAELRRRIPAATGLSRSDLQRTRDQVAEELGPAARMEEIRAAAFRRTLEDLGSSDPSFAEELTRFYLEIRFRELRLYDDVVTALTSLAAYELGLVSNGNSYPERVGLESYFTFVVFAHDHGVAKPEAGFYEAVLTAAKCGAHELIHVGDSIENDIAPAQALGIRTVWLNRDRQQDAESGAWAEIHSLAELPALVGC